MQFRSNSALCVMACGVAARVRCVGPVALITVASTSSADVINVPADQPTIQAGIDAASDGDVVEVAPGTYLETIDFIGKAITLSSTGGAALTTIDGGGALHVVQCVSGEGVETVLDGFTITGGHASGTFPDSAGGGMFNENSSPTVTDCTFTGNTAHDTGGGMYNFESSSPMVIHCRFEANYAYWGGGMNNAIGSSAMVMDCTFSGNTAVNGGGLHNSGSSPMVINCRFDGNGVTGVWPYVGRGGGMNNTSSSSPTVINCAFSGNTADGSGSIGGGMTTLNGSSPTVTNCTFNGNSAPNGRALAFDSFNQQSPSNLVMTSCILWDGGGEIWNGDGSAITIHSSDVQGGFPGTGNIDADPLFVDPDTGELRLQPGSPCIDAGDNIAVPGTITTDLDGNPRFAHDPCAVNTGHPDGTNPPVDMGAYEFQPPCPADLDCDGGVGVVEFLAIISAWGSCEDCPEDLNGDDTVAVGDFLIVLLSWGPCSAFGEGRGDPQSGRKDLNPRQTCGADQDRRIESGGPYQSGDSPDGPSQRSEQ